MKKRFKFFFFGFGQVAKYFLNKLIQEKYNFDLITTNTRKTENKIFKICKNSKRKLIIVKNGDHSLSKKSDLKKICNELNHMIFNKF